MEQAARLRALRGHRKQSEVSALTGLAQSTWSAMERGEMDLDADRIESICSAFNCSADWLLFGRGSAPHVTVDLPRTGTGG